MTINSISDLNKAVFELDNLVSVYKVAGIKELPKTLLDKESEIENFKYNQGITDQCTVCGAWKRQDSSFAVNFGPIMPPERLYVRVCEVAKRSGCLNANKPDSLESVREEHGFKPLSKEFINTAIQLESLKNDKDNR